jgi:hypothetical protein
MKIRGFVPATISAEVYSATCVTPLSTPFLENCVCDQTNNHYENRNPRCWGVDYDRRCEFSFPGVSAEGKKVDDDVVREIDE